MMLIMNLLKQCCCILASVTVDSHRFSIHARDQADGEMREAVEGMPIPVEGCPDVYHTGGLFVYCPISREEDMQSSCSSHNI